MREFPSISNHNKGKSLESVVRQVTRIRGDDIQEFDHLNNFVLNKIHTYEAVSTSTNIGRNNIVLVNSSTASRTVTLPAPSKTRGKVFSIKKADGSTLAMITEVENAGVIDNSTRKTTTTAYSSMRVFSDGAKYWTI